MTRTSIFAALLIALLAGPALAQMSTPVHYEGRWEIQPNGDVKVTRVFTLGMDAYRKWKSSDIHMFEARGFAASRSTVAIADRDARWDDMKRTLTMTMTVMGLALNMGDHWEAVMLPGEKFSNIDEGKNTAYFHFSNDSGMGRIEGQDLVVLPAGSVRPVWKDGEHKIVYELPYVAPADADAAPGTVTETRTVNSPLPTLFLVLFGVALAGGLMLLALSFVPRQNPQA